MVSLRKRSQGDGKTGKVVGGAGRVGGGVDLRKWVTGVGLRNWSQGGGKVGGGGWVGWGGP